MSDQQPFPVVPYLTSIAVAYRNKKFIADQVLPRVPVGKRDFKYTLYTLADAFTIPNTRVGRRSLPTEVEFGGTDTTSSVADYGLDDVIPYDDIEQAQGTQFDPRAQAAENLTDLLALDREKRTSDLVMNASNYASANKDTLSGTTQWSHASSDPVTAIKNALDGMINRANVLVLSRAVASALQSHAKIVAAAYPLGGNASVGGTVALDAIARLFELDEILVGEGFYNSAKPGQTATIVRVWPKYAAAIVRNQQANTRQGMTFGMTATWGQRVAGELPEPKIGLRGSTRLRVGESLKELLTANDLGFLWIDAVA
jgi:hypothetical protein